MCIILLSLFLSGLAFFSNIFGDKFYKESATICSIVTTFNESSFVFTNTSNDIEFRFSSFPR